MNNKLCFVQFIHPGGEHNVKNGGWNNGDHRRKFLSTTGDYLDKSGNRINGQELCFWGEWEPQSRVTPFPTAPGNFPHFLHKPYLDLKNVGTQNTDPFVFSEPFLYRCCQQNSAKQNSQLSYLEPGSVILFGSMINKNSNPYFGVDTVFVVSESNPYNDSNWQHNLKGLMPKNYPEIAKLVSLPTKSQALVNLTFYRGATYNNPYHGMYSFVPCRLTDNAPQGFERLKITHNDLPYITNNLSQGRKISTIAIADCQNAWQKVRDLCGQQGLLEGLRFDY